MKLHLSRSNVRNLASSGAHHGRVFARQLSGLIAFLAAITFAAAAPTVTIQSPTRNVLAPGQSVSLSVSAVGSGSIAWQWSRNGKPLAGATASSLTITNATYADGGWYLVDATDSTGTARSKPLFVQVAPVVSQLRLWSSTGEKSTGPSTMVDATALAANDYGVLALRRDGTVLNWAYNGYNGSEPNGFRAANEPSGLNDVVAMAAGGYAVFLKSDGTVVQWENGNTLAAQPALTNIVAVAAADVHALALRSDGTVAAWEYTNSSNYPYLTAVPAGLTDVVAVGAGRYHSVALKANGTIVVWGDNYFGQLNVPAGLNDVVQIAVQSSTSIARKADGTVVAWGNDYYGQATVPGNLANVANVAAANDHSLSLTTGGQIVAWGNATSGQGSPPAGLAPVFGIAGGLGISYALRDATGDVAPLISAQPVSQVRAEATSATFSVAATGVGPFTYQWRRNGNNLTGETSASLVLKNLLPAASGNYDVIVTNHVGATTSAPAVLTVNPVPVITSLTPPRQTPLPGQDLDLSVSATGTGVLSYQWVHDGRPITGATATTLSLKGVTAPASGAYWMLITDNYGVRRSPPIFVTVAPAVTKVVEWGARYDSLGALPASITDAIAIATNGNNTLVLRRDGTVFARGFGSEYNLPVGLTDAVAVTVGSDAYYALRSNGTVVAWGILATAPPADLNHVVSVVAGYNYAAALRSDGTIVTWGGSYASNAIPSTVSGVVSIAAGMSTVFALKTDGIVEGWTGYDANPAAWHVTTPVALDQVDTLVSGRFIHYAIKTDGSVIGWGQNYIGVAKLPFALQRIRTIAAGEGHSLALLENGVVAGWGENSKAQASVPAGLTNAFAIAAGGNHSLALCDASQSGAPTVTMVASTVTVRAGGDAQLDANVGGAAPFTIFWQAKAPGAGTWTDLVDGGGYAGTTTPTLRLTAIAAADGTAYRCLVANAVELTTGAAIVLNVKPALTITNLSASRNVISPGENLTLNATATGAGALSFKWRHNGRLIPGATSSTLLLPRASIQTGGYYQAEVTDDVGTKRGMPCFVAVAPSSTRLRAWGTQPALRTDITDAIALAVGYHYPVALRRDGSVIAFGSAPYGSSFPVPAGLSDVVALSVGYEDSYALKSDGTLTSWGIWGGNAPAAGTQVLVALAPTAADIAITKDGTIHAWSGFGNDNLSNALTNVVALTGNGNGVSGAFSIALTESGAVYGWGENGMGQARPPAGLSNVVALAAGSFHSLALKADGTVVAWGSNTMGQSSVPVGLAGVIAIAAGRDHSLAMRSDGSIVIWGSNANGEGVVPSDLGAAFFVTGGPTTSAALGDPTLNGLTHISSTFPAVAGAGSLLSFNSVVRNSGTRAWGPGHRLVVTNAVGEAVGSFSLAGTATNELGTASFTFRAPLLAGNHPYQVQGLQDGVEWFGPSRTLTLVVEKSAVTDFNHDGKPDLIWSNSKTGERALWLMNGTNFLGASTLGNFPLEWTIAATGDFNGDSQPDLVWSNNQTGERALWLMNGTTLLGVSTLGIFPLEWTVAATADFNLDGTPDLIWSNSQTGERAIWLMNGTQFLGASTLGIFPLEWTVAATADFNADGKPDIIWSNSITGERAIWLMNGTTFLAASTLGTFPLEWTVAGTADFNADGKPDIIWSNSISGERALWLMNGTQFLGASTLGIFPLEWTVSN